MARRKPDGRTLDDFLRDGFGGPPAAWWPPFAWCPCCVCGEEFRREWGWCAVIGPWHGGVGRTVYCCGACAVTPEAAAQKIHAAQDPGPPPNGAAANVPVSPPRVIGPALLPKRPANDIVFADGTRIVGGAGMSDEEWAAAIAALPWWRRFGKRQRPDRPKLNRGPLR